MQREQHEENPRSLREHRHSRHHKKLAVTELEDVWGKGSQGESGS